MGAGLVPARRGPATAGRVAGRAGRAGLAAAARRGLVGWAVGLFVLGAVVRLADPTRSSDMARRQPDARGVPAVRRRRVRWPTRSSRTMLLVLALLAAAFAVSSALRLRVEEASGRLEPLLAAPGCPGAGGCCGSLVTAVVSAAALLAGPGSGSGCRTGRSIGEPGQALRIAGLAAGLPARGARAAPRWSRCCTAGRPGWAPVGLGGAGGVVRARLARRAAEPAGLAGDALAVRAHPGGAGGRRWPWRSPRRDRRVPSCSLTGVGAGSASGAATCGDEPAHDRTNRKYLARVMSYAKLSCHPSEKVARTDSGLASALRVSVARLSRRLRSERDPDNELLPVGQLSVLGALNRFGESTVGELAALERVQPPSMTRTVNCLATAGYVDARKHETDGRQVVVALVRARAAETLADGPTPTRRLARAAAARADPRRTLRAAPGGSDHRKAGPRLSPTFRCTLEPQLPAVRLRCAWCRTSGPGCSGSPRTGWSSS